MPVVKSNEGESFTAKTALLLLNDSPVPNLPAAHDAAFNAPPLLFPDESAVEPPLPSSKPYAATNPTILVLPGLYAVMVIGFEKTVLVPSEIRSCATKLLAV